MTFEFWPFQKLNFAQKSYKTPRKVKKCPSYCIYDSKCELKHSIIARHPCKHVGLLKTLLSMQLILMRHALVIVSMVMRSSYTIEAQSKLHTHCQNFLCSAAIIYQWDMNSILLVSVSRIIEFIHNGPHTGRVLNSVHKCLTTVCVVIMPRADCTFKFHQ